MLLTLSCVFPSYALQQGQSRVAHWQRIAGLLFPSMQEAKALQHFPKVPGEWVKKNKTLLLRNAPALSRDFPCKISHHMLSKSEYYKISSDKNRSISYIVYTGVACGEREGSIIWRLSHNGLPEKGLFIENKLLRLKIGENGDLHQTVSLMQACCTMVADSYFYKDVNNTLHEIRVSGGISHALEVPEGVRPAKEMKNYLVPGVLNLWNAPSRSAPLEKIAASSKKGGEEDNKLIPSEVLLSYKPLTTVTVLGTYNNPMQEAWSLVRVSPSQNYLLIERHPDPSDFAHQNENEKQFTQDFASKDDKYRFQGVVGWVPSRCLLLKCRREP